jgi:hypothetical protein
MLHHVIIVIISSASSLFIIIIFLQLFLVDGARYLMLALQISVALGNNRLILQAVERLFNQLMPILGQVRRICVELSNIYNVCQ